VRVVSLVPSITETLFALGLDGEEVVGRTAWCVAPAPAVERVRIVGGTKTPSVRSIVGLRPDVVVLEREENRRETFEELEAAGVRALPVHVTRVADVPGVLEVLGDAVGHAAAGRELAERVRAALRRAAEAAVRLGPGPVAVPLIWREPLMSIGPGRYGADLLASVGFRVPGFPSATGYPEVTPAAIGAAGADLLLLSSEPHDFTPDEGREAADAVAGAGFPRPHPLKVDGRALTWFGARTAAGLDWWVALRERLAVAG